jgi:tRNA G18 (ribose-2'-O)-methylase SpoU
MSRTARADRELVYGRNAVLEAARAGRVRRALVARGLDLDPRLAELARLVAVEEVPPESWPSSSRVPS